MSELSVSRPGWRARAVALRLRSDDRLARDAASGDTAAFAALYERHHQPLYRYCRSIVADPEDAADALQSTMTRAFASIGERNAAAPVRAWLFRIAHNESISLIRRRRVAEPLDAETLVAPDLAADTERRGQLADLVRDLQGLSERQRGALLMREVSGLGHAEIAAALGATEGAVKQSIYEARVALQELAMGREMSCAAVRKQLSDGDGRTARSRRLRGHLRSCEECRSFRAGLQARRSELALIAPVLPAATAAAVLEAVIGAGGLGGGGLLAGLLGGSAAKAVAVGAATVTAGAGAVTYTVVAPDRDRPAPRAGTSVTGGDGPKAPKSTRATPIVAVGEAAGEDRVPAKLVSQGPGDSRRRALGGRDGDDGPSGGRDPDEDERGSSGRDRERDERDSSDDEDEDRGSAGKHEDEGHDSSGSSGSGSGGSSGSSGSSGSGSSSSSGSGSSGSSGSGSGSGGSSGSSGSSGSGGGHDAALAERHEPEEDETPEPAESSGEH